MAMHVTSVRVFPDIDHNMLPGKDKGMVDSIVCLLSVPRILLVGLERQWQSLIVRMQSKY